MKSVRTVVLKRGISKAAGEAVFTSEIETNWLRIAWVRYRWLILALLACLHLYTISGCGKANAGGNASVVRVPDPPPGLTCFAIANEQGTLIGGNCVVGNY